MAERRCAQRIPVHLPARYSSESVSMSGWIANLSRNGLFLCSDYLDDAGSRVDVSVLLPGDDDPLSFAGEVVRVEEGAAAPGMGIRFLSVTDDARRKLANFMIERSYQALH